MIICNKHIPLKCSEYKKIEIFKRGENFYIYPCCIYSFKYYDKPLDIITKDDILNNNVYNKLLESKNKKYYNDISLGCLHQNYNNYKIINTDKKYCDWFKYNFDEIIVSAAQTCNLYCKMCRNNRIIEDDSLYFAILEQLKGKGIRKISLTQQGEPFFYKNKTFDFLRSIKYKTDFEEIKMISNLTLLNNDDIYELKKISEETNVKYDIVASIDSINEDVYRKIRNNNLFKKVINNIELLLNFRMLKEVNFVAQRENISELLLNYEYWVNIKNIKFNCIPINCSDEQNEDFNYIINNEDYKKYLKIKQNDNKCSD